MGVRVPAHTRTATLVIARTEMLVRAEEVVEPIVLNDLYELWDCKVERACRLRLRVSAAVDVSGEAMSPSPYSAACNSNCDSTRDPNQRHHGCTHQGNVPSQGVRGDSTTAIVLLHGTVHNSRTKQSL